MIPRYGVVWLELAREQYDALPLAARTHVDARLVDLAEQPYGPGYDERTDQWTTTYGDGLGVILYAVVRRPPRVIVLRVV